MNEKEKAESWVFHYGKANAKRKCENIIENLSRVDIDTTKQVAYWKGVINEIEKL